MYDETSSQINRRTRKIAYSELFSDFPNISTQVEKPDTHHILRITRNHTKNRSLRNLTSILNMRFYENFNKTQDFL